MVAPLSTQELIVRHKCDDFRQRTLATIAKGHSSSVYDCGQKVFHADLKREIDWNKLLYDTVFNVQYAQRFINLHHEMARHPGILQVHDILLRSYRWPQAAAYIASSNPGNMPCGKTMAAFRKRVSLLISLFLDFEFLESVATKLLWLLLITYYGIKYLIVFWNISIVRLKQIR